MVLAFFRYATTGGIQGPFYEDDLESIWIVKSRRLRHTLAEGAVMAPPVPRMEVCGGGSSAGEPFGQGVL
jgi:hypothetical protein